jgi:hypothetical protein
MALYLFALFSRRLWLSHTSVRQPDRWVEGVSVDTYYLMPASIDFSTWVKVSTFKFRNTGYNDREYFYAPKNLIQDSSIKQNNLI